MQPITQIKLFRVRLAVVGLSLYWLAIFSGTHLPSASLIDVQVHDKVKHFSAFFGLTFLLCYVTNWPQSTQRFVGIAVSVLAYAVLDEWTQRFIPGRTPDTQDVLADAFGMMTAMTLYVATRRLFRRPLNAWVDKVKLPHGRG